MGYISDSKSYREFEKYMEEQKQHKLDSVVTSIINQFTKRAQFGKAKYGTDLDRKDLSILEWIEHAKQEHMDAILYLEKIKQEIESNERQEKVI